jgi:thiol:disulfide interchange protein DsbC
MYMKTLVILAALAISVNSLADQKDIDTIKQSMKTILPGLQINQIEESGIAGIYSILIGAEILYVTADGKYLMKGDLIDIPNKENLSEQRRSIARKDLLKTIPEQEFISFSPENPLHTVYVFTDITCGFCQKLQGDVKEINNRGIAIKYLAFPREGTESQTAQRMRSVWCSDDPQTAFIDAMIGLDVNSVSCENPVTEHFALGQALGVNGTPAIFTENGIYLRGYVPPDDLLKVLTQN